LARSRNIEDINFNFIEKLGQSLGIRKLDDWYDINILDAKSHEGVDSFLNHYGNSLIKALFVNYPYHDWKIWKFEYSFKGLTNDESALDGMQKKATQSMNGGPLAEDIFSSISKCKEWWRVRDSTHLKMNSFAFQSSSFVRENKESTPFSLTPTSKAPSYLIDAIRNIFPKEEILVTYGREDLVYSDTKRPFKLDVFLPRLSIAFEYLEDPNTAAQYATGSQYSVYFFSRGKRIACEEKGISLVEVPSYWNGSTSSLLSIITRMKPDLFKTSTTTNIPISSSPESEKISISVNVKGK